MDTIGFHRVMPRAFARQGDTASDVWGKDVTFHRGGTYLMAADSGRGKSTFCSYVMGYRRDFSGSVTFDGKDTSGLGVAGWTEVRKGRISCLFQELRLFPELTALENVEIKNRLTGFKTRKQVVEWFEALGIGDKLGSKAGHMSFGQQQRVAMIRALSQPFDFILADEPISHLDDGNSAIMGEILMGEVRSQGAGLITTSIGKHFKLDYERILRL